MANEIEIPLKLSGVQSLKAELRTLKAAIAEASDPEQMAALAAQAGQVADRIKDANEQVAVFTTGSKFESVSNSFSMIGNDLRSLDFEGAAEKAATFQKTVGNLGKADISGAITGLTKTVTTLGSTFMKLGAQILMNPIFLLVAVIVAIVAAIVLFMHKIGVLQKVIDFLMIPINLLIQAFKDLSDWLGLSSYAAEENARKLEKSNEKAFKSSEKRTEKMVDNYDIEIAKAKASGKDTTDLELKKSKAITDAASNRLSMARKEFSELKGLTDKDSVERRKKLRERIENENKIIREGSKERKLMLIQEQADAARAEADAAKAAAEEAKKRREEAAKKYREGSASIQKEIDAANKLVIDSAKTQKQKEIDDVKSKYDTLIKEAQKYKKDITSLEKARELELAAINKAAAEQQAQITKEQNEKKYATEDAQWLKLQELTLSNDEFRKLQLQMQYDNEFLAAEGNAVLQTELTKKLQSELNAIDKEASDKRIAAKKEADDKEAAASKELALKKINDDKAVRDAKIEIATSISQGLGAIGEAFIKDQKKLEKFNKAQALIQIGIDTAKAISALVAQSQANPFNAVTGGAAGVAQYAAGIVQIVTNIAKAKALLTNPSSQPSSGSGGGGGGDNGGSSSSSVPSFVPGNLFGQGNAANSATSAQGVETGATITVNAVVSETEMTGVQNKVNKILKNAVL